MKRFDILVGPKKGDYHLMYNDGGKYVKYEDVQALEEKLDKAMQLLASTNAELKRLAASYNNLPLKGL